MYTYICMYVGANLVLCATCLFSDGVRQGRAPMYLHSPPEGALPHCTYLRARAGSLGAVVAGALRGYRRHALYSRRGGAHFPARGLAGEAGVE